MSRLLLVRHGITESNSARRFVGQGDVDLSADGYRQVEKLRGRLANEKIDAVYSSDLKRALVTAEGISAEHKMDIVACPELREVNYGHAEGLTFQEIKSCYPEVAELIANFNLRLEFPGGEGFKGFMERVVRFLDRLEKHESSETILIVCHGGPLRTLALHLLGIAQDHWWQIRFDNASLSTVDIYPRGAILSLLNDTSHLRDNI
ncbi:histidine phosphatase family protein [Chloroflexota bacterium]